MINTFADSMHLFSGRLYYNNKFNKGNSLKIYRSCVGRFLAIFDKAIKININDHNSEWVNKNSLYKFAMRLTIVVSKDTDINFKGRLLDLKRGEVDRYPNLKLVVK